MAKNRRRRFYHCDWSDVPKLKLPPSEQVKAFKKVLGYHGSGRKFSAIEADMHRVEGIVRDGVSVTYSGRVSHVNCDYDTGTVYVELTGVDGRTSSVPLEVLGIIEQDAFVLWQMRKNVRITAKMEVL